MAVGMTAHLARELGYESTLSDYGARQNDFGCGMCIRVSCQHSPENPACRPDATPLMAVVTDWCPDNECQARQIDMYEQAWLKLSVGGDNPRINVERVECPTVSDMKMYVISSTGTYLKMSLQSTAMGGIISDVSVKCGKTDYLPMIRKSAAAWEINFSDFGTYRAADGSCSFRINGDRGEVVCHLCR